MGIIFFEVYLFGVNWLGFISRCNWKVSVYFWTIMCFLLFFLLFVQSVSLWILTFHIKVSNFLVDILKLHSKKFLKINKFINKTFVITIAPHDINALNDTHVYSIRFTVDICVLVYLIFQSVDFLKGTLMQI